MFSYHRKNARTPDFTFDEQLLGINIKHLKTANNIFSKILAALCVRMALVQK